MKAILFKLATFVLVLCILMPLLILWQGWAVSTLWDWFVVPLGLPAIGVATGAGFCLVAAALRARRAKGMQTDSDRFEAIAASIIFPLVAVVIGWIIKTFA